MKIDLSNPEPSHFQVVPTSVYCHSSCNLVVWRSYISPVDDDALNDIRISIARVMDRLADLLRDYQLFAPLVALVKADNPSSWSRLTGDQDWHRGRFVVQCIDEGDVDAFERAVSSWQGPLRSSSYVPRRLNSDDFRTIIEGSAETVKPPKGVDPQIFRRYTENVLSSIDESDPSKAVEKWRRELLDDLNELLEEPIIDDKE